MFQLPIIVGAKTNLNDFLGKFLASGVLDDGGNYEY